MRIEKVSVENFRLFQNETFSFHPQFNLIVGENGKGKTSLLNLLAVCMSAWIENIGPPVDKDAPLKPYDPSVSPTFYWELKYVTKNDVRCEIKEEKGEIRENYSEYIWIGSKWIDIPLETGELTNSEWNGHFIELSSPQKTRPHGFNGPTYIPLIRSRVDFTMPLFAFYGCNRLWNPNQEDEIVSLMQKAMEARYERRDGYSGWATAYADDRELMRWLQKLDIIAYQERIEPIGWSILQTALRQCLDGFERLHFMAKEGRLIVIFNDGRRVSFNHLSDGQRTLFAMIGDIVRRAVLLNPQFGDRMLEETTGVVLIDELDLHLHPKWQRRVIEDLRRTFPKIQFICTTHSPFLIQSLRSGEELIMLDGHPTAVLGNKSIEEIAQGLMGVERPDVSLRYENMKEAAKSYLETLEEASMAPEEKLAVYKERLAESIGPYADNPAFQAFLEMKRAAKLGE